ncbi:ABC transporter substrate-binding protein [Clostridium sediminicola]|uniref:ABC transporter substrate-binding protein n=1 Tax=Clostridium sediminicola TaxID=3114879 RepID=UPI0031F20228
MKLFKKMSILLLVVIISTVFMAGCGNSSQKTENDVNGNTDVEVANKESSQNLKGKKLVVYVTFHEEEGKRLLELFQEKTGVEYSYLRMPTGETAARVMAEKDSPKADIILGGPADVHQVLADNSLIEPYVSPVAADIPEEFKSPDGYWSGIYVGPVSIAVNEQRWKEEFESKGIEKPKTMEDLLNPAFKGEIIMPNPGTSGTAYTIVAAMVQKMGEDAAFEYFEKFAQNVGQFTKSGFTPAQKVATGEYLLGLNFIHDQKLMQKSGFKIDTIVPAGAGWEIGAASIIKNGPNTEAAKAFIDFMVGKEAGQLHTDLTERISTRADVELPKGSQKLEDMDIMRDYDFFKAAEDKKALQAKWSQVIGR